MAAWSVLPAPAPAAARNSFHALPAGRRYNPIHPQIFDHLAVMIEAMRRHAGSQPQPRNRSLSERAPHGLHQILLIDGCDRFVDVLKGFFQEFEDVGLARDWCRSFF